MLYFEYFWYVYRWCESPVQTVITDFVVTSRGQPEPEQDDAVTNIGMVRTNV